MTGDLTRDQCKEIYRQVMQDEDTDAMRELVKTDLFFLMRCVCNRVDMDEPWIFDRVREVEKHPDGYLDLWAREHYKSTIITFGKTLQDIIIDPEITVGLFSHTRPISKGFLRQLQREMEDNDLLKELFPDVFYMEPRRESPLWSLDNGIVVKRKSNPKEATIEASGLVDGQPTSKHYSLLLYDDVVTRESVTTPEQIDKVNDAWALSLNLGARGGRRRYIGTRYHFNDTYKTIMEREAATPRIYPATDDGTSEGEPVLLTQKDLDDKRREMGPYVFGCQMLQDPISDKAMGFREDWLMYYDTIKHDQKWNYYLLCDPAGEKKKVNDYTVMWVIALAPDNNYYLIDGVRDRLNLTERTRKLFDLHRRYHPMATGYEKYGKDSDIEHILETQERENYRFDITPLGGPMPKPDRIRKLVPIFEQHRFYLPRRMMFVDWEKRAHDLVQDFKNDEFLAFPVALHDDMLDCAARIVDPALGAKFPRLEERTTKKVLTKTKSEYNVLD